MIQFIYSQINPDYSDDTSAEVGNVKQTEAVTLSSSNLSTDTCYDSQKSASVEEISTTSKSEIFVKDNQNKEKKNFRSIPITIERTKSFEEEDLYAFKSAEKITEPYQNIKIPIEIIPSQIQPARSSSEIGISSENSNMKSIRTIPIHRMNSDSSCDSISHIMTKSLSKESITQSPQKIKMGTSAIRIPIQMQKSAESPQGDKKQKDFEVSSLKPPQSVRTLPILKQSLSDSGVSTNYGNKQSSRSRNASSQSMTDEKLQRVHEELEVSQISSMQNNRLHIF